jgi:hypothetical protein
MVGAAYGVQSTRDYEMADFSGGETRWCPNFKAWALGSFASARLDLQGRSTPRFYRLFFEMLLLEAGAKNYRPSDAELARQLKGRNPRSGRTQQNVSAVLHGMDLRSSPADRVATSSCCAKTVQQFILDHGPVGQVVDALEEAAC